MLKGVVGGENGRQCLIVCIMGIKQLSKLILMVYRNTSHFVSQKYGFKKITCGNS